jgi:hypothetical protein
MPGEDRSSIRARGASVRSARRPAGRQPARADLTGPEASRRLTPPARAAQSAASCAFGIRTPSARAPRWSTGPPRSIARQRRLRHLSRRAIASARRGGTGRRGRVCRAFPSSGDFHNNVDFSLRIPGIPGTPASAIDSRNPFGKSEDHLADPGRRMADPCLFVATYALWALGDHDSLGLRPPWRCCWPASPWRSIPPCA